MALGLVTGLFGYSGEQPAGQGVTPPDKEASKKIAEEMKAAMREKMKAQRSQMKGGGRR